MTTIVDGTAGVTFPAGGVGNPAGAVVGTTDTQTLTNKTITSPVINSISGAVIAGQASMEGGTSVTEIVTPGRQQFHPSAAKAWVRGNMSGATGTAYNVTSITDASVGTTVVTFTVPFSAVTYAMSVTASSNTDIWGQQYPTAGAAAVGSCGLGFVAGSRSLTDPDVFYAIFFGDQ